MAVKIAQVVDHSAGDLYFGVSGRKFKVVEILPFGLLAEGPSGGVRFWSAEELAEKTGNWVRKEQEGSE